MEKGATWSSTSNGFGISDNKASSNSDVVRLMKLHSDDAEFPSKIWMDIHRPVDAGGGGGGGEPGGISSGGAHEAVVGHVHRDDDASSSCVGAENYARSSTGSQPFDIFASSCSTTTSYKSLGGGGGGMAASVAAFPFTSAQWKELERQALIYKYMISSVPVPPHLLFPLSRSFPAAPSLVYNVGYTKNGDLEPGRCKRTDGKKWRCSKEVAPGQKYCERHLHRGRPRSRKPVEVQTNAVENHHKKTRLHHQLHLPNSTTATTTTHANSDPTISTSTSSYKAFNRDLGFMNREMVPLNGGFANEGSSIYSSAPIFHQDYYIDQLKLNTPSYSNSEFGAPTGYIDAWSADNHLNSSNIINSSSNDDNEYSLSWMNNGDFSPSLDLSIAMAAGNFIDAEMGNVRMAARDDEDNVSKDSNSRMSSPVFWEPFGRGGPLAEALQVASPRDSISTPATTVSSPSGVLHSNRTLFSHSDGSVCNSPTFAVPTSEAAFQRLN